jgi:hypothetical protein
MTEAEKTPKKDFWSEMSQKGKRDAHIQQSLDELFAALTTQEFEEGDIFQSSDENNNNNDNNNDNNNNNDTNDKDQFSERFKGEIREQIEGRLAECDLPPKERDHRIEAFLGRLHDYLRLKLRYKALCSIEFDAYEFLRFCGVLSSLLDETELRVTEDGILINGMDPSRVFLFQIEITNDSFFYFQDGTMALNLDDLETVAKCKASDNSRTEFLICKDKGIVTIRSERYNSEITRTLLGLDLDIEEIPMDNLVSIKYPFAFSLRSEQFKYVLDNAGIYSEVLRIDLSPESVEITEAGQIGDGGIRFAKEDIPHISADLEQLRAERNEIQDDERIDDIYRKVTDKMLRTRSCSAGYSCTFLKGIGKITPILDKKDAIRFSMRTDHPLRVNAEFKSLGDVQFTAFLSPRVEETEFDGDEIGEEF